MNCSAVAERSLTVGDSVPVSDSSPNNGGRSDGTGQVFHLVTVIVVGLGPAAHTDAGSLQLDRHHRVRIYISVSLEPFHVVCLVASGDVVIALLVERFEERR